MIKILSSILLIVSLLLTTNVNAGMCIAGIEKYMEEIEKGNYPDNQYLAYMVQCFTYFQTEWIIRFGNYLGEYNKHINDMFKTRERALKIINKLINSQDKEIRKYAIMALGFYRGNNALEYLKNAEIEPEVKALILGYLGDKNAAPLLIELFNEYDKKHPENNQHENLQKVNMLNVAYVLASPKLKDFLTKILNDENRPKVQRQKAESVLKLLDNK